MDLLRKPITSITFTDIVSFCQQGEREDIQLEYKRDLTTGSVPKSIAAFSNTRGGVIIIGVDENRTTGLPSGWNGIPNNGQNVDRIHQWASNVDPLPHYEVHMTDEQNGNVFILIRVFEGDNTPYYVHNDSHLWVRTGNVSTPIDIALPETQALLYQKRERAELARLNHIQIANQVWQSSLAKAERERKTKIGNATVNADGSARRLYTMQLGLQRARLRVHVQPFYPHTPLAKPSEIRTRLTDIRFDSSNYFSFPPANMDSIPEGMVNFEWEDTTGRLFCQQLYATGFIENIEDMSEDDDQGRPSIYLENIVAKIFIVLKSAEKFYKLFGYQGNVVGYAHLENLPNDTIVKSGTRGIHSLSRKLTLLPEYRWSLELDTGILNDNQKFQEYFIEIAKDVFWQLGFGSVDDNFIKRVLKDNRWLVE